LSIIIIVQLHVPTTLPILETDVKTKENGEMKEEFVVTEVADVAQVGDTLGGT